MSIIRNILNTFAEHTGIVMFRDPLRYASDTSEVTLAVPGYRQTESFTCGVIAGLMVLHTFDPHADIDRFYRLVNPDPDVGTSTKMLVRALRKSGVGVKKHRNLSFESIAENIKDGYPIITCVSTGDSEIDHWVVLYGFGRKPDRVFVASDGLPFLGTKVMDWDCFNNRWSPPGFGLVCWGMK